MNLTVKQQKPTDKLWLDEQGTGIPYNRTSKYEKVAEVAISKIAKRALALNKELDAFKRDFKGAMDVLSAVFVESNEGKSATKKGNITLYNFDRSIKVEVNVNEPIHFDEEYIKLAKAELDSFLKESLKDVGSWIEPLIMAAFEKSRGELDTDKVLSLKKHADRIKDERYHKAMKYIDKAINRPTSKEYYRVFVRGNDGQYKNIQLNFSSIELCGLK